MTINRILFLTRMTTNCPLIFAARSKLAKLVKFVVHYSISEIGAISGSLFHRLLAMMLQSYELYLKHPRNYGKSSFTAST